MSKCLCVPTVVIVQCIVKCEISNSQFANPRKSAEYDALVLLAIYSQFRIRTLDSNDLNLDSSSTLILPADLCAWFTSIMSLVTEFILVCLVGAIIWYLLSQRKPKNFPPGPWGLPIVGALPLLGKYPYKGLTQLKAKYGSIMGFDSFAGMRCVSISDAKLLKEVTSEWAFSGRPKLNFMRDRSGGEPEGIIFTEGRKWQEQKRFTLRKLRDFGFGTRSIEAIVHEEIQEVIEGLKKDAAGGQPISTQNRFTLAILNALWTIVAGERFQQDDPKVKEIFRHVTQDMSSLGIRAMLCIMIPAFGNHLPDWLSHYSKLIGPVNEMGKLIRPYIDQHMSTHVQDQPRDFLDTYIDEMKNTEDTSSSFHISQAATKSLPYTIFDLFQAGGETTGITLTWIFLYMTRHPHVQEKLHAEIDRVIGNSRLPCLADREHMPYMEAVIHEVMRVRPLVPATMQATLEDVEFHGYHIPKDTIIMLNIYDSHNDPTVWGDPENFRPERFLNKDESKFVHHEGFAAFSTGKRACLGERLARDELFLFGTALFQEFVVSGDPKGPPPSLEYTTLGVALPMPQKLVLTARS